MQGATERAVETLNVCLQKFHACGKGDGQRRNKHIDSRENKEVSIIAIEGGSQGGPCAIFERKAE